MMTDTHDTNELLQQDPLEEDKVEAAPSQDAAQTANETDVTVTEETETEAEAPVLVAPKSKAEVIERLKELTQETENLSRQEVDLLKQCFYKLHNAEVEAARKAFVDNGGEESAFVAEPDAQEEEFKSLMAEIKQKRLSLIHI